MVEGFIAFTLRQFTGSGWLLVDGILTVAVAAMIASAWPVSATWAVGVLVGVSMVSSGFPRLMVSIAVRRLVSQRSMRGGFMRAAGPDRRALAPAAQSATGASSRRVTFA